MLDNARPAKRSIMLEAAVPKDHHDQPVPPADLPPPSLRPQSLHEPGPRALVEASPPGPLAQHHHPPPHHPQAHRLPPLQHRHRHRRSEPKNQHAVPSSDLATAVIPDSHSSRLLGAAWKWPSPESPVPSPLSHTAVAPASTTGSLQVGVNVGFNTLSLFPARATPSRSLSFPSPSSDPSAFVPSDSAIAHELTLTPAPSAAQTFSPPCSARASVSDGSSQLHKRPRYCSPPSDDNVTSHQGWAKDQYQHTIRNQLLLISPFKDCVGNFSDVHHRRYQRPFDGKVNGYIKFNWPKQKSSPSSSCHHEQPAVLYRSCSHPLTATTSDSHASASAIVVHRPESASFKTFMTIPPDADAGFDLSNATHGLVASSNLEFFGPFAVNPSITGVENSAELVSIGALRKVPSLFGYEAKMDQTDRKLWTFYIKNWCPGRSVLTDTNLWLKDFAQMHKSDGVRAAIQSLAGIYIYDYQPIDGIRKRVNDRFTEAKSRFSQLLSDPSTAHNETLSNEFITMAVILSIQDIVLTERRLRKPYMPRWLSGFKQSELFLQAMDQGSRFWKRSDAQLSSLRISQSIMVGRATILVQPMMKLPAPDTFDPEYETSRMGWLLCGTERDMYQIHGGCGFSRKLLHTISQITYCAARLQQDPGNTVVPITTQYLYTELMQMRQWSSESQDWETARAEPAVIEWVRAIPDGLIISSSADMTDVTAEAWRLTAVIYLQCRAWRIPRNHPTVIANLSDLAKCIDIMPTSGYQFTAQAPLFPVFLLGMLATEPDHLRISKTWFDEVVSTPVRSSVPPLYEVLKRIWQWINVEIPLLSTVDTAQPGHVGFGYPWWEQLVQEVDKREIEVLCLT